MTEEHRIQNQIRDVIAYYHDLNIFRANVGKGWAYSPDYIKNPDGSILIPNPNWFSSGLPRGFPDLFGYKSIIITPDMVGKKFAWFTAMEVKTKIGKLSTEQAEMLKRFDEDGCLNGVVRSVEDSIILVRGGMTNANKDTTF